MQRLRTGVLCLLMAAGLLVIAPAVSGQQFSAAQEFSNLTDPLRAEIGEEAFSLRGIESMKIYVVPSAVSRSTLLGSRWEDPGQVEPALAVLVGVLPGLGRHHSLEGFERRIADQVEILPGLLRDERQLPIEDQDP